jgi:uncharacterized protein YacL
VRSIRRSLAALALILPLGVVCALAPLPAGLAGWLPRLILAFSVATVAALLALAGQTLSTDRLAGSALGLLAGSLAAALLVSALRPLPPSVQWSLAIALAWLGLVTGASRGLGTRRGVNDTSSQGQTPSPPAKLLDTSAIIDGRIADLPGTGFLEGRLLVPSFVLRELQTIADSDDPLRRARGRRGLEVLEGMRAAGSVVLAEEEDTGQGGVDERLVDLAARLGAAIITHDRDLARVAVLRGVRVLNLHELAAVLRPVLLPGEGLEVRVVKGGREPGQGVAYLDDGTMIVVDEGQRHMGETLQVIVTSVLKTSAGTMFFARPAKGLPPVRGAGDRRSSG